MEKVCSGEVEKIMSFIKKTLLIKTSELDGELLAVGGLGRTQLEISLERPLLLTLHDRLGGGIVDAELF